MQAPALDLVSANKFCDTRFRSFDGCQEARDQRPEISEPIAFGLKNHDRDRERNEVLLKGQISINRNEHVEGF
jgi:hypothetical protein